MNTPKFSTDEAIQFGWNAAKRNIGFFVILLIVVVLAQAIPSQVQTATKETAPFLSFLFALVSLAVGQIIAMGLTRISLKFADSQPATLSDLYADLSRFFSFLFAGILYVLIVTAGLILLIVPGIMWAVRFGFYGYLVIDKGAGPMEAIRKSAEITQGARWQVFLLGILMFGILLLGAIALLIGLLWAIPTTLVAAAFVYRKLLDAAEGTATAGASTAPQAGTVGM
jgi:uncharacterized membrane protein